MGIKTIVLTGATGFLGSNIARVLVDSGYEVIILKRSTSVTDRIKDILGAVKSYDIDKVPVKNIFKEQRIDGVIHAATSYGRDGESMSEIVNSNLMLPISILEEKPGFFINVDTFFKADPELPGKLSYYVLSKKQLVDYGRVASIKEGIYFINIVLGQLYGPGDSEKKFIPMIISKMLANEDIDLTEGKQKRDFIYVQDAADAFLQVVRRIDAMEPGYLEYELSTNTSSIIKDAVMKLAELTEYSGQLNFGALPYRKNEIMEPHLSQDFMTLFKWSPKHKLKQGLKLTVEYYAGSKVTNQ